MGEHFHFRSRRARTMFGALLLVAAPLAFAESEATAPVAPAPPMASTAGAPLVTGFLEGGIGHANLTGGNADWNDQYLRGGVHLTPKDYVTSEVSHQSHFGDHGTFVGLGYTRTFNDDWYGFLSAGTSTGGFFLPRYRIDGNLYRKLLEKKNLVVNIGFTYYRAREIYTDKTLLLGATYYFEAPWIIQIGARLNRSDPGSVRSNRGVIAVTYGRNKDQYITLMYDTGREAYQLTGGATLLNDFTSHETSLTWRRWITRQWGFNLRAIYYENPFYKRKQVEGGIFYEF
nr:YaiO family outer membrane beta-barrel protein [uncultured Ralstonia sp.]